MANIKKSMPVPLMLIVCFMLCTSFNIKETYALETVSNSSQPQQPMLTLSKEETKIYNSKETISVTDIANSYKKLAEKLQVNESEKETAIQVYEDEQARIKAEEERKRLEAICNKIIETALSKRGCSYVWGAIGPNTFDCSGLTQWAYKQNGITIPRVAAWQARAGTRVSRDELRKGDLVFFRTDASSPKRISHVGMYIGNGQMVHAPQTGDVVKISNINTSKWRSRYAWACRYAS